MGAKITDAAMSQRAEWVALSQGAQVVKTLRVLDDILQRIEAHPRKKSATRRPLRISSASKDGTVGRGIGRMTC
jgi:hypothetical protein